MTRPAEAIEMLRLANPVPPGSAEDGPFPTVAELRATWRSLPTDHGPQVWAPGPSAPKGRKGDMTPASRSAESLGRNVRPSFVMPWMMSSRTARHCARGP